MTRVASTVGWGLFCTASWTWCIGMYLPVILVRHWGWPGFWAFAIPNVLGCAAFGYLCSRATSVRLCAEHRGMIALFSAVTVAYQTFFLAWMWSELGFPGTAGATFPMTWAIGFGVAVAAALVAALPLRTWPWIGSLATLLSLALWPIVAGRLAAVPGAGAVVAAKLAWAVPIIAFGFLLCPWLDRTFHIARQRTPSPHSFAVFGVSFFAVILLSALYTEAGALLALSAVTAHISMQAVFTAGVHLRTLHETQPQRPRRRGARFAIAALPFVIGTAAADLAGLLGIDGETLYLLFLGCYGLLFPAYVLLFMRGGSGAIRPWPLTTPRLALFAVAMAVLSPVAAIGFLRLETWLLAIPVLAVGALALLGPRGGAQNQRPDRQEVRDSLPSALADR